MAKSEKNKKKKKDGIPGMFSSVQDASEFWDTHSVADYWDETSEVKDTKIHMIRRHFHIDADVAGKIHDIARGRGISTESLVNLWLKEKIS